MQGLRTWAKEPLRAGHREMTLRAKGSWEGAEDFCFMWYVYLIRYIQCKLEKNAPASKHIAPVWIPPKCPAPAGQPAFSSRQLLELLRACCPAVNFGSCRA